MLRIIILLLLTTSLSAQDYDGHYHAKVATLDGTIETLYSVISGDAGERRNWSLFTYLFTEDARLTPISKNQGGQTYPISLTPEEYVKRSGAYLEANGFFEKEIHRIVDEYGALTHVFSTYESFRSSKDKEPFARGINSIQLMNDGSRWWIVNITWQGETSEFPIPDKYLD